MLKTLACLALFVLALTAQSKAVDQTREEKTKGDDVAYAVVNLIRNSQIFPEDHDLLERIAYLESKFGENPDTFRPYYFGGIWQVDESLYSETKNTTLHPSLTDKHNKILSTFGIDWVKTKWEELLKPLSSGLAARLRISAVEAQNHPIPQTVAEQAKYWNAYYNRRNDLTESNFTNAVNELENKTSNCRGKMDLVVLLDGSGSIGASPFQQSLAFVADLFGSYSSDNVRKGFLEFGDDILEMFDLDNRLSDADIKAKVLGAAYLNQATNTNKGILASVEMYTKTAVRAGVPRVFTVFTDGESNRGGPGDQGGVPDIVKAKQANLTTYAIGIGSAINPAELNEIAYGDPSHVFYLTDFDALTEFFRRLNKETCSLPQQPGLGETTEDVLAQNEKRYFELPISSEGVTVFLQTTSGKTEGYYSYTVKNPSSAMNDGVLANGKTFIPYSLLGQSSVFVTIKGTQEINEYGINIVGADTPPVDNTLTSNTYGEDVVKAVLDKIRSSNIFTDDYEFFERVAYTESKFGKNPNTFRPNYFGGIWQVDELSYAELRNIVKHPNLKEKYEQIQSHFKIDWQNQTNWTDLLKPLYSGLAARLYVSTVEDKNHTIPQTVAEQAKYWYTYYNRWVNVSESNFTDAVKELQNKTLSCKGKMDLLVLLDGSGSVGESNFKQSLGFVADLFGSYSSDNVRKGFLEFSDDVLEILDLQNQLTEAEIKSKVLETKFLKGYTNTNEGILASVDMYNQTPERAGIPKVLTVFTSGASNRGGPAGKGGIPDIIKAKEANLTTYAVGIGSDISLDELNEFSYGDLSHVFTLTNVAALTEFFRRFNKETCSLPQKPEFGVTTSDILTENERRYYDLPISTEGLTVSVQTTSGEIKGYYSYSARNPSTAEFDGVLTNGNTFIPQSLVEQSNIFVAIKGTGEINEYAISFKQGS